MNQRPSRNCITRLAKRAEQLTQKGIVVAAIQFSKIDQNALNEWIKKYNIPFPVGVVQGDAEKAHFNWGVKSLPWLILTDSKHVVRAEGFGLDELEEKIRENENVEK
jgi:translation elongation factor EF-1beta